MVGWKQTIYPDTRTLTGCITGGAPEIVWQEVTHSCTIPPLDGLISGFLMGSGLTPCVEAALRPKSQEASHRHCTSRDWLGWINLWLLLGPQSLNVDSLCWALSSPHRTLNHGASHFIANKYREMNVIKALVGYGHKTMQSSVPFWLGRENTFFN